MSESIEGYTLADIDTLLDMLDHEYRVFVGANGIGLPEIQSIQGATHLGYGVFKATTPDYEVTFDGGHGMSRLPSEKGYTIMGVNRGEYPYDFEAVRVTLNKLKASIHQKESHHGEAT